MPGQRMEVRLNNGKVECFPEKKVASLRGRCPASDFSSALEENRV